MKWPIYLFPVLFLCNFARAQSINDQFNGSSIDTGIWTPAAPFSDSSTTETGGNAVLTNHGQLLSTASFVNGVEITGRFMFAGSAHDSFIILTRTDGTSTNPFSEFDKGIRFQFSMQTDPGSTLNNLNITENNWPGVSTTLAYATFAINLNTYYDFKLTDNGNDIKFYIDDLITPVISVNSSFDGSGDKIGLYNREGGGGGSWISNGSVVKIDYLTATPVPEPTTIGFLFSLFLASLIFVRQRATANKILE